MSSLSFSIFLLLLCDIRVGFPQPLLIKHICLLVVSFPFSYGGGVPCCFKRVILKEPRQIFVSELGIFLWGSFHPHHCSLPLPHSVRGAYPFFFPLFLPNSRNVRVYGETLNHRFVLGSQRAHSLGGFWAEKLVHHKIFC